MYKVVELTGNELTFTYDERFDTLLEAETFVELCVADDKGERPGINYGIMDADSEIVERR